MEKNILLKIMYSWGDGESEEKFHSKDEAWSYAAALAKNEAETSSIEHCCEIGLFFDKENWRISLHWTYDDTWCRYDIVEE